MSARLHMSWVGPCSAIVAALWLGATALSANAQNADQNTRQNAGQNAGQNFGRNASENDGKNTNPYKLLKPTTADDVLPLPSKPDGATGPGQSRDGDDDVESGDNPFPITPADDPSADPPAADDLDPLPAGTERGVVQDGDPNALDPPGQRDGVIDAPEPRAPQDGSDTTKIDSRDAEEAALFTSPPDTEIDPLLFQIEDIEPVENRKIERLFKLEPYDPAGIKIGSFVLFPEVETAIAGYSNVFSSPVKQTDIAYELKPALRLVSAWSRHALELRGSADLSAYSEFDTENDKGYFVESRGRYDIARRTNVQGLVSRELVQESRSAIDASSAGTRANLTTDKAAATFNHRFNRLSLQLRGGVTDYDYGSQTNGGVVSTNADRNYTVTEEAIRATWEFKSTFSVFAETAFNQRDYDVVAQSDLISRSSEGERYRLGVSFGETGEILRGEASVGYGRQSPDDGRLADIDGFLFDANVSWRMSELTTLLVSARTDVSETTTANSGGVLTRSAGAEIRHAFRRYLIATAGLSLATEDYFGAPIEQTTVFGTLGLEYYLNRDAIIFGTYQHAGVDSNQPASDYAADEVRIGLRLRR